MKKMLIRSLSLTALVFSASAVAAPCPADIAGSCTVQEDTGTLCVDALRGLVPMEEFKTECTSNEGVFAEAPCATANRVGSCLMGDPSQPASIVMRSYAPLTPELAQMICAQAQGKTCE